MEKDQMGLLLSLNIRKNALFLKCPQIDCVFLFSVYVLVIESYRNTELETFLVKKWSSS